VATGERALYVESARFRHVQVEHNAVRFVVPDGAQELRAGRERLDGKPGRGNQSRQGNAHVRIVVNYGQQRRIFRHHDPTVSADGGRSNWTLVQVSNVAQAG
jgi:hypothetical protein